MSSAFPTLQGQQYMNLVTYRKNGTAMPTPVWFAEQDNTLYVFTLGNAGKVKRIRNNGKVQVGPCDARGNALGPLVDAQASIVDGEEARKADAALSRKYGLMKRVFTFINRIRGKTASYIAVRPQA